MSPLKAIHQQCFDCIYDSRSPGTKHEQTEACTAHSCALYEFRPITGRTKAAKRQAIVSAMSPEEKAKLEQKRKTFMERINK